MAIGVADLGGSHDVFALADAEVLLEGAWAAIALGLAVVLLAALTVDVALFIGGTRGVDDALAVGEAVGERRCVVDRVIA